MGRKVWTVGEVIASADLNTYLMNQSVQSFSSTSVRSTAIATATEGMVSYLTDVNQMQHFDGTNWLPVAYSISAGTGSVSLSAASAGSVSVTFPASRFTVAPLVVASCISSNAYVVSAQSAGTAGFTLTVRHVDATTATTTVNNNWMAIQMTAGTAAG